MRWQIRVYYQRTDDGEEEVCVFRCDSDLHAWRLHELLFKCNNVVCISKPEKCD